MDEQPLSQHDFDLIYSKVPRLTVEVVVKSPEGVLLTKRAIEPCIGQWHIPGGTVYFGETLEQAVRRVAASELGIEVNIDESLGLITYPKMHAEGYHGWPIGAAFQVSIASGSLKSNYQSDDIAFFRDIPENTIPDQKDFLESSHLLRPAETAIV